MSVKSLNVMKVSEFLKEVLTKRLQHLEEKNLCFVCDDGVDVYVVRTSDFKSYYCDVVAGNITIAFFPICSSIDTCDIISRAVEVLDFLGYVKHIKM